MGCIDLTNQIFGDLKVIERDYNYGKERNLKDWNKKTFWKCICIKCGAKTVRQGTALRKQKEKTTCTACGKSKVQIGYKYGKLTILSKDLEYPKIHNIKGTQSYFSCLCDCGNTITKRADYLLQDKEPNCGCIKKETFQELANQKIIDLTNQKFGLLTVLKRNEEKSKPGQIFWDTICECGRFYTVCGKHLKNGATISCGCYKASIGEKQIEDILLKNNISYKKEYVIPELNYKRFDFAIFENDKITRLIEFDGIQHFKNSTLFGDEEFQRLIKSDLEKNKWAIEHKIPLVRIPYFYKNKITFELLFNEESLLINSETFNDHQLKY